jgi:hypothetical protein
MAEKARLPQIPSTVWWGVRAILNKTPSATVDERFLSIQLGVQEVAAKQYIAELVSVGILNEDNKATPLAHKWRLDSTYHAAVDELIEAVYPEGLRHVAPPGEGDRQKAVNWFQQEGLGEGTAKNKAATYFLLGTKDPNEAPPRVASTKNSSDEGARSNPTKRVVQVGSKPKVGRPRDAVGADQQQQDKNGNGRVEGIPLNVNVQIHISADAGTEQIEAIFSAMRRYLHDKPNS